MPRGVNKAIIVGHLGSDPETRELSNGGAVANVSVATSESWKDKSTGERREQTEWHRVVFFNRLAEIVAQYLRKGSQVYIEGRIQTRKWQDKDGHERYSTEIVAHEMQMLGGKGEGAPSDGSTRNNAPSGAGYKDKASSPKPGPAKADDFNDEIPF